MGEFLRRNIWVVPVLFAALLAGVGVSSYRALETQMIAELEDRLRTILEAEVAAIEIWAQENRAAAQVHAASAPVRGPALALLELARRAERPAEQLRAAPEQAELRDAMREAVEQHGLSGFAVVDGSGLVVAADRETLVGTRPRAVVPVVAPVLDGESRVTPPLPIELDPQGEGQRTAVVLASAPLRLDDGSPVGAFLLAIAPERAFQHLLRIARLGESGETYAFDRNAVMVSQSRFDDQLRRIGVLPEDPAVTSFYRVEIRDPGGNLVAGHHPELPVKARPLTRAAAGALAGGRGVDVSGYPDYRGVPVVGAWAWVPQLEIGIVTEVDQEEAYRGLLVLRRRFGIVIGVVALAALGMFLYTAVVLRLRRQIQEARQVGRYKIVRKLGSGGMGTVYLASHALLRRPTAIKILRAESTGREGTARFEREVQVTSSLNHPNTVEIYDFGHTPDGTFYYAMEYLHGVTLGRCVDEDGPQPEARVVHVMRQVCASIAEAHAAGLMHRDLKPSNVMLCERGGISDFVKVLDFGLVRPQERGRDLGLTDTTSLTGTPLYMPPEAVQSPEKLDVRGDVYQLGLIAYFLVVGRHAFRGETPVDVMLQQVSVNPDPPSRALGRSLAPQLEAIVMRCLEKSPDARPSDAGELLEAFETCEVSGSWGQREARAWWQTWRERNPEDAGDEASTASFPTGYSVDLARRLERG